MADQYVRLSSDSTGKKVQSYENTINSQVVEACATRLVDSAGYSNAYVQVATDSSGKKMQTFVNTVGANSVHALACVAVNTSGVSIYG